MTDRARGAPKKRKRDVRTAVLLLLAERPMSGSEMIEELSVRSRGDWRPTAATIYPTLQMLVDDDLVTAGRSDDGKRRHRLTDAGRAEVEQIDEKLGRKPWEPPPSAAQADLFVAVAETAKVVLGAVAAASDEQRADLVAFLEEVRRRIAGIVPEAGAGGGRGGSAGGWPLSIPDWIFGGAGGGTGGLTGAPGPFGRKWPWWRDEGGRQQAQGPTGRAGGDYDDDGGDYDDDAGDDEG